MKPSNTADRILDFVRRFIAEQGYAPSYREIAEGAGLATTCHVGAHLDRLERADRLRHTKGVARSIVLLEDIRCELCGRVTFPLCPDCGEAMEEMNEDHRREGYVFFGDQSEEMRVVFDEDIPPGTIEFWQGGELAGTIYNVGTEETDDK